jgi:hypothetical protein
MRPPCPRGAGSQARMSTYQECGVAFISRRRALCVALRGASQVASPARAPDTTRVLKRPFLDSKTDFALTLTAPGVNLKSVQFTPTPRPLTHPPNRRRPSRLSRSPALRRIAFALRGETTSYSRRWLCKSPQCLVGSKSLKTRASLPRGSRPHRIESPTPCVAWTFSGAWR